MVEEKVCAYIDILGFGQTVCSDLDGAGRLLSDYYNILLMKVSDERLFQRHYTKEEKSPTLKSLYEKYILSSFEYFIPFSDAAFVVSSRPSAFVFQMSNFMLESFMLGGYIYDNSHLRQRNDLLTIDEKRKTRWYPLLFRGGVAFGECIPIRLSQIVKSQIKDAYNVFGSAVLKAVQLEELGKNQRKGPCLLCSRHLYDNLNDESKNIVVPTNIQDAYEVLWPMPYIQKEGINGYRKLLGISINLWQYYTGRTFGIKYLEFVKLVIRSILEVYKNSKDELYKVSQCIEATLKNKNISVKEFRKILDCYGI